MIGSFIIFGASNHLGETSKHHFRTQDGKMLQNGTRNAWNTGPQESRTIPAGVPHQSRTGNRAVNRQPGSRPRDLWSRFSIRSNMSLQLQ